MAKVEELPPREAEKLALSPSPMKLVWETEPCPIMPSREL
jgi:hypothetical protein